MRILEYEIKDVDTLESISKQYNQSVEEIINFHNQNCGITQQIIGNAFPVYLKFLYLNTSPSTKSDQEEQIFKGESSARYRCEQSVMTYIGGMLINHIDTKREFLVDKFQKNDERFVNTKLVENLMNSYPEEMKEAVDLVSDIDLLACNLQVALNKETGKIDKIINHNKIVENWKLHKENLKSKYGFLRNSETKENLQLFLQTNDEIFLNEGKLKEWVNNKMFFDLFFDKYLVSNENLFGPFKKDLYSQLFEGKPIPFEFRQDIITETQNTINVRKVGEMMKDKVNIASLEEIYDIKFKPLVNYQFSEFKFSYRENSTYDLENTWITASDVTIIEEIKNNVRLMISYKLTKIEL